MTEYFDCTKTNLKKGDKGKQVTLLQTHLKTLGYYVKFGEYTLKIDGDFGTYTQAAVKQFQKDTGHTADGVFGPKTCPSLNQMLQKKEGITVKNTPSTTSLSNTNTTKSTTINPLKIDTSKNILSEKDSNIHIQGLHFLMTNITFDVPTNNADIKYIELLNGKFKPYTGHDIQREYTIETKLTLKEFRQLESELIKIEQQACYVVCPYFKAGNFNVKYNISLNHVKYIKLTMKLKEYY